MLELIWSVLYFYNSSFPISISNFFFPYQRRDVVCSLKLFQVVLPIIANLFDVHFCVILWLELLGIVFFFLTMMFLGLVADHGFKFAV